MSGGTSGAALVGLILEQVAAGVDCGASELAERLGATRTTVFDAIAQLEAAGLVERDARGRIAPGPLASRLGYAVFGLAPIAGAAEALLPALHDSTDACAEIVVVGEGETHVLAERGAAGRTLGGGPQETMEARIAAPVDARVRLRLRAGAARPEIAAAQRSAQAVADVMSQLLSAAEAKDRLAHRR